MGAKATLYRGMAGALRALDQRGVRLRYPYPDRLMLEQRILPAIAGRDDMKRILMVGCGWYTHYYPGLLGDDAEVTTLEIDPAKRAFGARRHIVANLTELDAHFGPGELDAVLCNGVLGWGLNDHDDIERAFGASVTALRGGGLLLLGWNDKAPYNRVSPADISALQGLEAVTVPGLEAHRVIALPRNQHCFQAFTRPQSN
ncbi:methyltransferase domain-containing protein [Kushneria aurantia]|uniref:Methyltransferase domain-containing protein n=1 Tax=Kushneria aurantia TaxID=504092 RepID=A0ABV6FZC4_9GAMM|nr:class I SAM-dependent methyltransferase [Kushneria aurantia]